MKKSTKSTSRSKKTTPIAGNYVDGFVLAVPKRNLQTYKKMSNDAGKVWMEHGALQYIESVGDDMNPKMPATFPKMTKVKKGEVVVFAWIVYKSRASRDSVLKKVMKDPRMDSDPKKMPFDMNRMAYAGFKMIVKY
jgi:uncharacterized protein YbaA (DUF1428 family)